MSVDAFILFICVAAPMTMMIFAVKDKTMGIFLVLGTLVCLYCAYVNGFLLENMALTKLDFTCTITPIVEEVFKALPVFIFAFAFRAERERVIAASFAVGVGFAILENVIIIAENAKSITVIWAIARGFGAGLLHSVTVMAIGMVICILRDNKKLRILGCFAIQIAAITFHAIYNMYIQSGTYFYIGLVLPVCAYIPIIIYLVRRRKISKNQDKPAENAE